MALLFITIKSYAPDLDDYQKELERKSLELKLEYEALMQDEFSEENLRRLLFLLNVVNLEYIIKQSKLETGHYTSSLFRNHNALFGMHYPRIRKTTSSGWVIADGGRKVAKYDSWQSSVMDFILYLEYWVAKGYPLDDYPKFLVDVHYCEKGSTYIDLLNRIK
jgi:uncharacterized FlgJ-related protein